MVECFNLPTAKPYLVTGIYYTRTNGVKDTGVVIPNIVLFEKNPKLLIFKLEYKFISLKYPELQYNNEFNVTAPFIILLFKFTCDKIVQLLLTNKLLQFIIDLIVIF
jgi:hypothetical protein